MLRWLMLILLLLAAPSALAQESTGETTDVEALIATLEDEAEREALIETLETLIAADQQTEVQPGLSGRILDALSERVERVGHQLSQTAGFLSSLPAATDRLIAGAGDAETRVRWLRITLKIVSVITLAWLSRTMLHRMLKPGREKLAKRTGDGVLEAAILFLGRVIYGYLPIAVFAAVALVFLPLTEPVPTTRVIGLALVYAVIFIQAITILTGLVFGAGTGRAGIMGVSDASAYYIRIWVRRLALVGVLGTVIAESALLLGLPAGAHAVLLKLVGLAVAALLVILVLQNRRPLADAMRSREGVVARLADIWHVPALLYIAIAYGAWMLQSSTDFTFLARATGATAVLVTGTFLVLRAVRLALERGLKLSDELRRLYPRLEQRANRYMGGLRRVVVGLIYIVATLLLIEIWFGDTLAWLASELGRALIARLVTIVFILVAAATVWELVNATVERLLSDTQPGAPGTRSARMRTLLPLVRNVARVVLGIIVTLTVLSELGLDIAPLLAGAGIAGLAIGFGAQSLVKDVITGIFILLEDSITVGDVVNVGGHSGVVEGMTVRTVRLRDLSGNVHVVPFGEVQTVLNMTKDFAYALIEAGVAYKEDVDEVIGVLKEIGDEMCEDEEFGPMIMAPLEVMGLDSFGDSSVNIRVRMKTRPIKQWSVRREYHRRMKRVFDERGIEIPFPHRTVLFPEAEPQAAAAAVKPAPAVDKRPERLSDGLPDQESE